jgi:hypothetical protein
MKDYITIGSTPAGENCAQVGSPDYFERSKKEMKAYINQIRREFGSEPVGARLSIKSFPHDFGTYSEVICYYYDEIPESVDYALKAECPNEYWDVEAKKELGLLNKKIDKIDSLWSQS